jgi:hypothetical protein
LQQRLNNLEDLQVSPPDIERAAKYIWRAIKFREDKGDFRNAIKEIVDEAIGDEGAWGVALDWTNKIRPDGVWQHKKFIILDHVMYDNWAQIPGNRPDLTKARKRHFYLLPCFTRSYCANLKQCLMHNFVHI